MSLEQRQNLVQTQRLSQSMLQSLGVLQKQSAELAALVREELENNPLLEEVDEPPPAPESDSREERAEGDSDLFEATERLADGEAAGDGVRRGPDDEDEPPAREIAAEESPEEKLLRQLELADLPAEVLPRARYLVDSLDERGWLAAGQAGGQARAGAREPWCDELDSYIDGALSLDGLSEPSRKALEAVWDLDPVGLGGRDLRETLMLQAERIPGFPRLALAILDSHFDLLERRNVPELAAILGTSRGEVEKAIEEIGRLELHPGAALESAPRSGTVSPDAVVSAKGGRFSVVLCRGDAPAVRVNRTYAAILDDDRASREDKAFVREKLAAANSFLSALAKRGNTIELVVKAIVRRQKAFFLGGRRADLRPMVLQDIADDTGLHMSTVNRVTSGRYVQTDHGVVDLRSLFTVGVVRRGPDGAAGEATSSEVFKEAIRKMLEGEDRSKPFSDQAIADFLGSQGLAVARRTVAKYREQLGIPPAGQRRRY